MSSKSALAGQVRIPGSKSHTIRAVLFASLANGRSTIRRPMTGHDGQSAVTCYRAFGAQVDTSHGSETEAIWHIDGVAGRPKVPNDVIDVGNSGTTLRLAMGTATLLDGTTAVFTGDAQVRSRPSGPLLRSLNDLGAKAFSTRGNDLPPYVISGPATGGHTQIEAISSQFLSSLLCCCPFIPGDSKITVSLLNEKPYAEITLACLDRLGLKYQNADFREFRIPGGQHVSPFECEIPGDFSSATFFLCAAALAGNEVTLLGLDLNDTQGDKAVVDFLRQMGARVEVTSQGIVVSRGELHGTELDLNNTPDALPALAVTACFADGPTRLYNVPQARYKETDRIAVMTQELTKLGAKVRELPDGILIDPAHLRGRQVNGHGDHRVVMALALAGLVTDDPVTVQGSEAAAVTFPEFADLMCQIGAKIREEP